MVTADGDMTGYLSNGCIDRDIQARGVSALATGERMFLHYGQGSQFMDLKLPCGGSLKVLIDPAPDTDALLAAAKALQARQAATLTFDVPTEPATQVSFTYRPKFRVVLAGRGAAFRATATVAHAAGFEISVMSPEADDLTALAAVSFDPPVSLTTPESAPDLSGIDENSAFLTLFHDHDWEPALLQSVIESSAAYIGCLGSDAAQAQRKAMLTAAGVPQDALDRIHGPIGLVGGLRDAQLIAISAMAEVTQMMPPSVVAN